MSTILMVSVIIFVVGAIYYGFNELMKIEA